MNSIICILQVLLVKNWKSLWQNQAEAYLKQIQSLEWILSWELSLGFYLDWFFCVNDDRWNYDLWTLKRSTVVSWVRLERMRLTGELKGCVGIGDAGRAVDSGVLRNDLQGRVRKEDTGWIISQSLTDPSCRPKNMSLCVILSGFSLSVSNSAEHPGHG